MTSEERVRGDGESVYKAVDSQGACGVEEMKA